MLPSSYLSLFILWKVFVSIPQIEDHSIIRWKLVQNKEWRWEDLKKYRVHGAWDLVSRPVILMPYVLSSIFLFVGFWHAETLHWFLLKMEMLGHIWSSVSIWHSVKKVGFGAKNTWIWILALLLVHCGYRQASYPFCASVSSFMKLE